MSRWFACLVLGMVAIVFVTWKADAGAALPVAQPASKLAAEENESPPEKSEKDDESKDNSDDQKSEDAEDNDAADDDDTEDSDQEKDEKQADEKSEKKDSDDSEDDADASKDSNAKSSDKDDGDDEDDEKDDKPKAEEKKKPKPFKVKRKPLKIEAKLDGYFVADEMKEIVLRPEAWTQFKVTEAVDHGTPVKKGQVLVRFDDEKIEEELSDGAINQRIAELSLMQVEEEFPRDEKLLELTFQMAKTSREQLLEDYEYYKNTDRPFIVRIANYRYNQAKEDLESQREELAQLEKMYAADELTEETEAIVLRRQKFAVSTAELILDLGEDTRNQTLNVMLPRNDESYARRLEQSRLEFEQAKTQKEMGETLRKYGLEKKRESRVDSVERHAKLVSDRALMVVKAPTDGIVYYGRCVKGKWSEVNTLSAKLRPFGVVSANTVIMTIVKQRPLHMETSLTEKELPDFNTKLAAVITPGADDKLRLTGKITKIETIPGASGRYAVSLDVDTSDAPDWLVAGMTCDAKVKVYENKEALLIPTNLVQTDEEDETTKYVMLVEAEDEDPVRRDVKLGRSKEKMVEVLRGLGEGDEIVKEEKKDEKEEEKKDESKKDD